MTSTYRWLLPSAVLADARDVDAPPPPRTPRDWIVDVLFLVVSAALAVGFYFGDRHAPDGSLEPWQLPLDAALGAGGVAALWFRRRAPVTVFVVTALFGCVSAAAAAANVTALFTVAIHRRWQVLVWAAVLSTASGEVFAVYRPEDGLSLLWATAVNVGATLIVIAWGMFVRARRELVRTLRERAERAEAEQRVLADRARLAERTRIAREMHDVLAHRISLLALHAGGLQLRPDLPAAEVRQTAELLRATAHSALEELREVIGVLREGDGADAPAAPQPGLRDIARLVADTRDAGTRIDFEPAVPDVEPPGSLGRDAYRIVQEALTNIAKHARGTAAVVRVSGEPGGELRVTVRNRLPVAAGGSVLPGSGSGLVGLRERVTLAGGTLRHGPTDDGAFEVDARLQWPR